MHNGTTRGPWDLRSYWLLAQLAPSLFYPFEIRRKKPLKFLIEIQLLRHLAGEVPLYQPNEQEIQKRTKIIYDYLGTEPIIYAHFMMKHAVNDDHLVNVIKKLIIAEKYAYRNLGISPNETNEELLNRYNIWIARILKTSNYRTIKK